MNAAVYCRVSTRDQIGGTSLDEQRSRCVAFAEAKGWTVTEPYVDGGLSGASTSRPEWQRMLADCRAGVVSAVVVLNLTRFSRTAGHALTEITKLRDLGVVFASVKEQIDLSTPAGRLSLTLLAGVAEFERDTIAERGVDGQRAKARDGRWPGGDPPFGWRLDGKGKIAVCVQDPQEAQLVLAMVGWVLDDGLTTHEVAVRCNAAGWYPRKGGRWDHVTVRRCLKRRALVGELTWSRPNGRTGEGKHHANKKWGGPITFAIPPLVDGKRFAALQEALGRTAQGPRAGTRVYPLSGRRLISPCGGWYNGTYRNDTGRRSYLCCRSKWTAASPVRCGCPVLGADAVEARVWSAVVRELSDPVRLQRMAADWLQLDASNADSLGDAAERVEVNIGRLERALTRAAKQALLADDDGPVRAAIAEIEAELADARGQQRELAAWQADADAAGRRMTDLAVLAQVAADRLPTMTATEQLEVLALLDVRVTVSGANGRDDPVIAEIAGTLDPRLELGGAGRPPEGAPRPGRVRDPADDRPLRPVSGPGRGVGADRRMT